MSNNFSARITLTGEEVFEIEVWVHEMAQLDPKKRTVTEWVEDHLQNCNRSQFIDLLPEGAKTDGNLQILFTGWMKSIYDDYHREYDEEFVPEKVEFQHLPDDWFENENSHELPMVKLQAGGQ